MIKPISNISIVCKALEQAGMHPDTIGKNKEGNIIIRKSFFYRFENTSEKFTENISKALYNAGLKYSIIDSGEHWTAFRGGASVANQSHWYVVVKLEV